MLLFSYTGSQVSCLHMEGMLVYCGFLLHFLLSWGWRSFLFPVFFYGIETICIFVEIIENRYPYFYQGNTQYVTLFPSACAATINGRVSTLSSLLIAIIFAISLIELCDIVFLCLSCWILVHNLTFKNFVSFRLFILHAVVLFLLTFLIVLSWLR